jgi:hypothetical protein
LFSLQLDALLQCGDGFRAALQTMQGHAQAYVKVSCLGLQPERPSKSLLRLVGGNGLLLYQAQGPADAPVEVSDSGAQSGIVGQQRLALPASVERCERLVRCIQHPSPAAVEAGLLGCVQVELVALSQQVCQGFQFVQPVRLQSPLQGLEEGAMLAGPPIWRVGKPGGQVQQSPGQAPVENGRLGKTGRQKGPGLRLVAPQQSIEIVQGEFAPGLIIQPITQMGNRLSQGLPARPVMVRGPPAQLVGPGAFAVAQLVAGELGHHVVQVAVDAGKGVAGLQPGQFGPGCCPLGQVP